MRKYLTCLLLIFSTLGLHQALRAQAQLQIFADSLNGFLTVTSAVANDVITYDFTVYNVGNVAFNDSLYIMARAGTNTFMLADSGSQFIPVSGFKIFTIEDTVTAARYDGGVNVVVIWPTSPSIVGDSIMDSININLVGIKDGAEDFLRLTAFPNPTTGDLYFEQNSPAEIAHTTLIGINGQILDKFHGLPHRLSLSDYPVGLYLVKIETVGGRQITYRIRKN